MQGGMMTKLKPEFLKKNGRTEFVVLTAEDYAAFQEMIEDARDVLVLRAARAQNNGATGISLAEWYSTIHAARRLSAHGLV